MSDETSKMTGAEAIVGTLANHGVTACFANPGTSEMHLVTALDHEPRIRSVLCLFEGVATGAADGFGRIAGTPAMTLLHLGAGYLNAGANIHNAKRANTPMVNVIGDHAVPHLRYDAPLTSNIVGLAGPNSIWIKSVDAVADAGKLASEAFVASYGPSPGPVSLLLPADSAWLEGAAEAEAAKPAPAQLCAADDLEAAAERLKAAKKPVVLIGGNALSETGLAEAGKLSAANIRIMTDTFYAKMARGAGRFVPDRMQYFAEGAMKDLDGHDLIVVIGTQVPIAFFSYPGKPSVLVPEGCETLVVGGPEIDAKDALERLAGLMGAAGNTPVLAERKVSDAPSGELSAVTIGKSLNRHLPRNAFVSDDGVSNSLMSFLGTQTAEPHDWMMLTGGAIGMGMPLALGASVAAPDRKGLCITGDGAGMYTNQALWSMAREGADVVTVVFVNHSYRILNIELARTGAGNPGPAAKNLLEIGQPDIDWVALSTSMGVPAEAVDTAEAFDAAVERAFAADGPRLIAAHIPAR
jgi:acetolactate synthase-1/2/3 large subunit